MGSFAKAVSIDHLDFACGILSRITKDKLYPYLLSLRTGIANVNGTDSLLIQKNSGGCDADLGRGRPQRVYDSHDEDPFRHKEV
jgi:hypothetical protein